MRYVYIIQNTVSRCAYLGTTRNPQQRWLNHKSELRRGAHRNPYLQRSWDAHSPADFDFLCLAEFETQAEADAAECFYIAWYKALGLCYNSQNGGQGPGKFSDETREKIREANLRNGNRPPSRAGQSPSPEAREKIRQANLARGARPPSFKGKKLGEEHKRKLLEGRRGVSPRLGATTPPETREKQRAAALRRIERDGPQPRRPDGPYEPQAKS